jgi:hypothetical protein
MDEMRRIGGGTLPASAQARRGIERRSLAERVQQVRSSPAQPAVAAALPPARAIAEAGRPQAAAANGRNGKDADPSVPAPAESSPAHPSAAAEMPQGEQIPSQRRRRLLDRLTGLAKS